jgi:hypothetical protein
MECAADDEFYQHVEDRLARLREPIDAFADRYPYAIECQSHIDFARNRTNNTPVDNLSGLVPIEYDFAIDPALLDDPEIREPEADLVFSMGRLFT